MGSTRNINRTQLESFVREIGTQIQIPQSCAFALDSAGRSHDVAIFDFSTKRQVTQSSKFVQSSSDGRCALVVLVGDEVVEPFWPQGTGTNRAILSGLDAMWLVHRFAAQMDPL